MVVMMMAVMSLNARRRRRCRRVDRASLARRAFRLDRRARHLHRDRVGVGGGSAASTALCGSLSCRRWSHAGKGGSHPHRFVHDIELRRPDDVSFVLLHWDCGGEGDEGAACGEEAGKTHGSCRRMGAWASCGCSGGLSVQEGLCKSSSEMSLLRCRCVRIDCVEAVYGSKSYANDTQ